MFSTYFHYSIKIEQYMAQYHAGYYLESVLDLFKDEDQKQAFASLMKSLSRFELESNKNLTPTKNNACSLAMVACNIISRGLPTKVSLYVEDVFADTFRESKNRSLHYIINHPDREGIRNTIFKALHIIDPRLTEKLLAKEFEKQWDNFGSEHEDVFYYSFVPEYLGPIYLQLIQRKKYLPNVLKYSQKKNPDIRKYFDEIYKDVTDHRIDFAIEYPYQVGKHYGIAIEIDEDENDKLEQRKIDQERNSIIEQSGWTKPFRFRSKEFVNINSKIKQLQKHIDNEYFAIYQDNFQNPLYDDSEKIAALQFALSPFGIARIQKAITECLMSGKLKLSDETWEIGIIERDVPCALIAVEDIKQMLEHLIEISGLRTKLPNIELTVFYTDEFKNAQLRKINRNKISVKHRAISLNQFSEYSNFDLLIDVSVLMRQDVFPVGIKNQAKTLITIRSSHSVDSSRKFKTGELIKYSPILKKFSAKKIEPIPEREKALEYFLQNLFRKDFFLPGQLEILDNILQLKNTIGYLPPSHGKAIVFQLSALLQPGIACIVTPTKALSISHTYNLETNSIDAHLFTTALPLEEESRNDALNRLYDAEAIFSHVEPEIFMTENFREISAEMYDKQKYFSYFIVDEAHCLSEWGHDFRTEYSKLGKYSKLYCKTANTDEIPTIALTSVASYNVLGDLCAEFRVEEENIIRIPMDLKNINFTIQNVDCKNIFYNTPIARARSRIGSTKQVNVSYLINDTYRDNEETPPGTTLVFCPNKEGLFGISDANYDGLADKLSKNYKELNIKYFLGSNDDRSDFINGKKSLESENNFKDFLEGDIDVMVGTKTIGIGIDCKHTNQSIHVNMPASIEQFVQESGRILNKTKSTQSIVLYNDQIFASLEEVEVKDKEGNYIYTEKELKTSIDRLILKEKHRRKFRGIQREKSVIDELLTEITFPIEKPADIITDAIKDEFGEQVEFAYLPAKNPFQLFINKGDKTYGYIDYRDNSINTDNSNLDKKRGNEIFAFVQKLIEMKCPKSRNVFRWITHKPDWPPQEGVSVALGKMKIGDKKDIIVHFRNDKTTRITEILNRNISDSFTEKQIYEISKKSHSAKVFIDSLNKIANINLVNKNINLPERVKKLYYLIRNEEDTLRAIYRMWLLGVIDDYTIDFDTKTITLSLTKKDDQSYTDALSIYLKRYISEGKANLICSEIENMQGRNTIYKCLYFMIEFANREISVRNLQGVSHIDNLCKFAINEEKSDKVKNKHIKAYLKDYFESKYLNALYTPNIETETKKFTQYSFDLVMKFIGEMRELKDNWAHMYSSTEQLVSTIYMGNYFLLLLNAYTGFLLHWDKPDIYNRSFNRMINALLKMSKNEKLEYHKYIERIKLFLNQIYQHNHELKEQIEPLLFLRTHITWLTEFNKTFLEGFASK